LVYVVLTLFVPALLEMRNENIFTILVVSILFSTGCISDSSKGGSIGNTMENQTTQSQADAKKFSTPEISTIKSSNIYPTKEGWALDRTYELGNLELSGVATLSDSILFVSDITKNMVVQYNTDSGEQKVVFNLGKIEYLNLKVSRVLMAITDMDSVFVYRGGGSIYKFQVEEKLNHPTYFEGSNIWNFTIVDQGNNRLVTNREGIQATLGKRGSGPLEFESPSTVVYMGNSIYVSDTGNKRIQVIDLEGNFEKSIGESIVQLPTGMTSDQNVLFVLDRSLRKIFLFNIKGDLLYALESELTDPRDLYFRKGELYVSDSNGQVKVFANSHYNNGK